jgi:signal transduction histidine kinase
MLAPFNVLPVRLLFAWMIVCVGYVSLYAQEDQPEQENEVEWFEKFFTAQRKGSPETLVKAADDKLHEAQESEDKAAYARALIEKSLIKLTRTNESEQALELLIQSLALTDSLGLKKEQVLTYLAMARVFEQVGDYNKSSEMLNYALALNASHDSLYMLVLNDLGRINIGRGQMEDALENYEQLLVLTKELGDTKRQGEAQFYLGILYTKKGQLDEALAKHKEALVLRRKSADRAGEALSLNTIGTLYALMKNPDRALANYVASLEINVSLKSSAGLSDSYNNIGILYYQKGNFERSIANLELARQAALKSNDQQQALRSYDYLSFAYKELKNFEKALEYREAFLSVKEMIQNESDQRKLTEMQTQYVLEGKELKIDKLEADRQERERELEAQKKFRNFLFALIGLGIVIIILVLYLYIQKQRANRQFKLANEKIRLQNEQLQQLNATKDKFFSIISHDLKGPLNSLTSFSGLLINYFDSLSKEEIQTLAKDLDKSLKNLFALLENLLEWSRSQTGAIEFKPEAFDLAELVQQNIDLLTAQAATKEIRIEYANPHVLTVMAHKNSVTTVIRNLISNAIKFTPKGGTITLSTGKSNEEALVSIADTGVGMSKEVIDKLFRIDAKHSTKGTAEEKGTGLGLVLCKDFVEKNNGNIGVQSEEGKGSTFYFTLPTTV